MEKKKNENEKYMLYRLLLQVAVRWPRVYIVYIIKCIHGVDVMRELIDFPEGNLKTNSNGVGT